MNRLPLQPLLVVVLFLAAALLSLKQQSENSTPFANPLARIPLGAPSRSDPTLRSLDQFGRNNVLETLALADRQWVPKAELLANGSTRFSYKRRAGEPSLSIDQIRDLMMHPPTFSMERRSISRVWQILERAGVEITFSQSLKVGAAGEWDAKAKTIRIRPQVLGQGSKEFARVLNHEALHVAQSCKHGSPSANPELIGLSNNLSPSLELVLQNPPYRTIPLQAKRLEREAFAHQADLDLGPSLVQAYCF